jgi:hypothetical protein
MANWWKPRITVRLASFTDDVGQHGAPGETWISIITPYNPDFLAEFKAAFTPKERKWNYAQRFWLLKPRLKAVLETWLNSIDANVIWDTQPPVAVPPNSMATTVDHQVLQIAPHACYEVAQAAYRALSLKYHPDRGGLVSDMSRLNDAWGRLKKGYGK